MTKHWSRLAKKAKPYVPGLQLNEPNIIKLNTNENPYPPSPRVMEAIEEEGSRHLQLYPSSTADNLKREIGSVYDLTADDVFVGNGSDEVLAFSFMAFFEPDEKIRYPNITYSFYPVYARLFNIPVEDVPVNEDFTLPTEAFFNSEGGVIFPNPNAPTSMYLPLEQIEAIVQHNQDKVVIIDEAYVDFSEGSAASLIPKYDNLLVVQTTSKSRSLAGLRVGYALGHESLINALIRIKDSFNSYTIDRLALVGAQAAFEDVAYFEKITKQIMTTRETVTERLKALGFTVLPSQTNFVFATHSEHAAVDLYEALKSERILVRHFNQPRIDDYLRITIGTDDQMDMFFEKLKPILKVM